MRDASMLRPRVTVDRELGDLRKIELLDAAGTVVGELRGSAAERRAPFGGEGMIALVLSATHVEWRESSRSDGLETAVAQVEPAPLTQPAQVDVDEEALLAAARVDREEAARRLGIELSDDLGVPPDPVCNSCGRERPQHKGRECTVEERPCEGWR